ncbi:hypothetical protein S245_005247, partial [Arachis hypogaea]
DKTRRAYIKVGPNQPILDNYLFSGDKNHYRFQASWFKLNLQSIRVQMLLLRMVSGIRKNKGSNSFHHKTLKLCYDLIKQSQRIDRLLHKQTSEEIKNNRIRLGASIDCCAYTGHDESQSSSNKGVKGMTVLVACRVSEMVCKFGFLKILHKHI